MISVQLWRDMPGANAPRTGGGGGHGGSVVFLPDKGLVDGDKQPSKGLDMGAENCHRWRRSAFSRDESRDQRMWQTFSAAMILKRQRLMD